MYYDRRLFDFPLPQTAFDILSGISMAISFGGNDENKIDE